MTDHQPTTVLPQPKPVAPSIRRGRLVLHPRDVAIQIKRRRRWSGPKAAVTLVYGDRDGDLSD